jgi:uncharacterized protein YndB with AHSA1/START domain
MTAMKPDLDPNTDLSFTRTLAAPRQLVTAILLLEDAPGGGTTYTAIARHRNSESRKTRDDMGFFDGWGTVATQLEVYAKGLMT